MSFFSRFRSPLLKNTGSVARDHLASERTFLAWMRIGLAFTALGLAVQRFSQLELSVALRHDQSAANLVVQRRDIQSNDQQHSTSFTTTQAGHHESSNNQEQWLVAALLGTGTGSLAYGVTRYFSNLRLLEKGLFRPAYFGAGFLGLAVAGFTGLAHHRTMTDALENRRMSET